MNINIQRIVLNSLISIMDIQDKIKKLEKRRVQNNILIQHLKIKKNEELRLYRKSISILTL